MKLKVSDMVLFPTNEEGRIVEITNRDTDHEIFKIKIHKPGKTYYRGEVVKVSKDEFKKVTR